MTIAEYAEFKRADGADISCIDGIWWRRVRPFFYQPLFPFQELIPNSRRYPLNSLLGGVQHIVPDNSAANSRMHLFVWDNLAQYSLDSLNHHRRNSIRKGLKNFTIQRIDDIKEFTSAGHQVYLSFYSRTGYDFKRERVDKKKFAEWAEILYRFSKIRIMGAYQGRELTAISIYYPVQDVVINSTFMGKTEFLKFRVSDLMIHDMRERVASCSTIRFIFNGTVKGERGLDDSKLERGCRILSRPAYYRLNPAADALIKKFMTKQYDKLTGTIENYYDKAPADY